MTAPAEGSAQGGAAEAIYDRRWGRMASLATGNAGDLPTLGLAAGLSGHEVQPALSGGGTSASIGARCGGPGAADQAKRSWGSGRAGARGGGSGHPPTMGDKRSKLPLGGAAR
jgi:hypothetical protein